MREERRTLSAARPGRAARVWDRIVRVGALPVLAVMLTAPYAQAQVLEGTSARSEAAVSSAASTVEARPTEIQLLVGRSTVLNVGQPITRVSLTSADVADALVTSQQQLLVHGKAPGTITMFVWDRSGGIRRYEVVVQRDLSQLVHQMKQLFPGEPITVTGNGEHVVLSGTVSSKYVVDKAAEVAAGYVKKADDVVNLLKQQEGIASQQVLLRVRFAEVSRSAMTELGASFAANGFKDGRWFGRATTQAVPAPEWNEDGKFVFSDFLNLFLFDTKNQLAGVIRALQSKGLFQSLAEPNLIAENGKEASFLAGGEYPYPVVQGAAGGNAVTIQFKEFGVKLNFTPTIVGEDLIKLKVAPEVSSLDFANAVVVEGFRVPAISTRRTSTEIELQDGQTFAIAGLMNNTVTQQMSKIPGIGDIPILGLLFRSKQAQKNQTELVVMITPQILRRNSTGVSPRLPNLVEPYLGPEKKQLPPPAPWNPAEQPQAAVPTRAPAAAASPAPQPVSQPAPSSAPARAAAPGPAAPAKLTKEQKKALERARKEEEARRKAEAKAAKEQAERDRKAAEEARRQEEAARKQREKMAREQAKLEKELAARRAEAERRRAEEEKRRQAEIAEAERRLKQAQAEYQAALGKDQNE
ncbi:MAG TPA: type II and III secretion system protein family protein [Vicinamibacterales bacterium]|nr:type II and III secretion system protein family protein [Vicinamibacterales bacterium]